MFLLCLYTGVSSATVFNAIAAHYGNSDVIHVATNERRVIDAYVRISDETEFTRVDFDQTSRWTYSGAYQYALFDILHVR